MDPRYNNGTAGGAPGATGRLYPSFPSEYGAAGGNPGPQFPSSFSAIAPGSPGPQRTGAPQHFFNQAGGDILNTVTDSAIGKIGLSMGSDVAKSTAQKLQAFISVDTLKYYFNVNNSYVLNKIKVILFPFANKSWKRRIVRNGNVDTYLPPRDDLNAPDLYIPLMAFVTFVLVYGIVVGTVYNTFTPDILGLAASRGLAVVGFEVLLLKLGFYLLSNAPSVLVFDLIAYSGYIFVSIVFNMFVGLILGGKIYLIMVIATGLFMGVFMVKTLRLVLVPATATALDNSLGGAYDPMATASSFSPTNARNYFLFAIAVLQPFVAYFLGHA